MLRRCGWVLWVMGLGDLRDNPFAQNPARRLVARGTGNMQVERARQPYGAARSTASPRHFFTRDGLDQDLDVRRLRLRDEVFDPKRFEHAASPPIMCKGVFLPRPEGPTRQRCLPLAIRCLMLSTAGLPGPFCWVSPTTSMAAR